MPNRSCVGAVLAALILAACADNQAPDTDSRQSQLDPSRTLPVLTSAKVLPAAAPDPGAAGQFTISLRFINAPTATQATRFDEAKAKWEGIILGDVPDVSGTIPARSCGNSFPTPPFKGTIDDILIDVLLQPIDGPGAILGAAGPCLVRSADHLSLYGIMFFDTADLDFLEGLGFFDEVVTHEMGHVLGFGSLWNFNRALLEGAGTADPRFVGPLAIAAYAGLGGSGTVPVEGDQGGAGTRDSHWDEATFYNELMTGFLNSGARTNPLSVLSIASMGDLGYVINPDAGDKYKLPPTPGPNFAVGAAAVGVRDLDIARGERLVRPTAMVQ
ncbi:MAG TPA: leishmanolysin-related zinc metalloendopeptidase [Gemmatimonadales bacterium]|nr:leishmanolysin-related zinc metalloendopeptidase [Gemmatimonadales bacterium]